MKTFINIFSIVFALIFVINFYSALGQVVITSSKKNYKYGGDMVLFGQGEHCPPGFIKDGGKKGKTILAIPECKPMKKKTKIEYVPLPYPVKQYIPIMTGKKGMSFDMDMGYAMDSKKSVKHVRR